MISKILFKWAFMALIVTGILNWLAYKLYLYWTVWWIDMVVHFFGGLFVALTVLWMYSKWRDLNILDKRKIFFITLIGTIFVGILWEIFELYLGVVSFADGMKYITDTISDLLMDTAGGITALIYLRKLLNKLKNE